MGNNSAVHLIFNVFFFFVKRQNEPENLMKKQFFQALVSVVVLFEALQDCCLALIRNIFFRNNVIRQNSYSFKVSLAKSIHNMISQRERQRW